MPMKLQDFAAPLRHGADAIPFKNVFKDNVKGSGPPEIREVYNGGYRFVDGIFTDNMGAAYAMANAQQRCLLDSGVLTGATRPFKTLCVPFITMILIDTVDYS